MAAWEEAARLPAPDTEHPVSRAAAAPRWLPTLALAALAGVLFALHLEAQPFFDNEGRYAAVAREMVERGDPITPRMNGTLFLNKPPLLYWLAAATFVVGGFGEHARLIAVAAAVVALVATSRLGARLFGARIGLLAAAMLATTVGFVLEARTLRPDGILVAVAVLALLCWHHVEEEESAPRRARWLVGLYVTLGVGVLAKGLVPVITTGIPIAALTLWRHGWGGVSRLRPGLAIVVIGTIVLPWHVAVSLRHPGFAWDYVVNQHLLFFFDKKLPRDSVGDPLPFFWAAMIGRALPWVVFVPLALPELAAVRRAAGVREQGALLGWAWAGGVMLFFSLAPSRLEHYSLPALPALALLAARGWERLRAGDVSRKVWPVYLLLGVLIAGAGVTGLVVGRSLLARVSLLAQAPGLFDLVRPAGMVLAAGGTLIAAAALYRSAAALLASVALAAAPMAAIVLVAQALVGPLFSWGGVAETLRAVPAGTEIVFEAPEEYQLVGGLTYYTGRRITLLEVPGFVPPPYLAADAPGMFLARGEFERRWRAGEPLVLVSDPQRNRASATALVPEPHWVLARFGHRWVVANHPVAGAR